MFGLWNEAVASNRLTTGHTPDKSSKRLSLDHAQSNSLILHCHSHIIAYNDVLAIWSFPGTILRVFLQLIDHQLASSGAF